MEGEASRGERREVESEVKRQKVSDDAQITKSNTKKTRPKTILRGERGLALGRQDGMGTCGGVERWG